MSGPPSVNLSELLERIAGGDRAAFRALYGQAGPRLFAICMRMMKARNQAEDIFQEAWVKVWERSYQYDPGKGDALAWLATVTRHCALDRLRKGDGGRVPFDDAAEAEIDLLAGAAAMEIGDSGDLRRCLEQLREDYRNAVVLAYVEGLTHEELAARLRKPTGTIKSWVRRGVEQLKGCMDE